MCGITGSISRHSVDAVYEKLNRMEAAQRHRGPDAQDQKVVSVGHWNVGLGHQRLAIIDLSDAGIQPMWSASRRYCLIYNGEVYNYREMSETIDAELRSQSDTEVLLEHIEQHGLSASLKTSNGMWAFALLDTQSQNLYLVRDRVGIKPLYYTIENNSLVFASEVKSVLEGTQQSYTLNQQVLFNYLQHAVQDATNESFFNGIHAVPAGHVAKIDLKQEQLAISVESYWQVPTTHCASQAHTPKNPETKTEGSTQAAQVRKLFSDAVTLRMRSDVPIGVTLSGGIDSSAIAAVMNANLADQQTFGVLSAVSPGTRFDESPFIDVMAGAIDQQVNKVQLDFDPVEELPAMSDATWHNDAPLGTFSNLAYLMLMRKAREMGLTVVLSGQGADELLCGYKKYLGFYIQSLVRKKQFLKAAKTLFGFMRNRTVLTQLNVREAKRYVPLLRKLNNTSESQSVLGPLLNNCAALNLGLQKKQTMAQRQAADVARFSVPYLLHYEDRMSMACGIEVRLPFLDYRLIQNLVPAATSSKLYKGWTKYVLRQALVGLVPDEIVWRKDKLGFSNPEEQWLRNELRDELTKMFSSDALIYRYQIIDKTAMQLKYQDFLKAPVGKGHVWYREIFAPFALEIWLQRFQSYLVPPQSADPG